MDPNARPMQALVAMARLFQDGDLRAFLEERKRRMEQEIESFDRNRILSGSMDDLTKYFYEGFRLDPVRLLTEKEELDDPPQEVMVDARNVPNPAYGRPNMTLPGVRYVLRVPFEGSPELFRYQPGTYTYAGKPIADIDGDVIILTSDRRADDPPERVRDGFSQVKAEIIQWLGWVKGDLEQWLPALRRSAWERIEARKKRLTAAQDAASRMGFKLRERADAPKTFAAPQVRRKMQPVVTAQPPGS